jgi:hypothetical protein
VRVYHYFCILLEENTCIKTPRFKINKPSSEGLHKLRGMAVFLQGMTSLGRRPSAGNGVVASQGECALMGCGWSLFQHFS